MTTSTQGATRRQPVPRGIARHGPVLFSYGFRPFFLGAGIWATLAMGLWIGALAAGWEIGGSYGGANWHAHEMLFGYTAAALAGFLLTAVPNWTGRLPVSGGRLILLFGLWCAGRLALIAPDVLTLPVSVAIDSAFLPMLLAVCGREILAGRKWKDLKMLVGILVLASANIGFHLLVTKGGDTGLANRLGIAAFVMLIAIMGGRVVPSFTRNWLAKRHDAHLPAPFGRFDIIALLTGIVALVLWVATPDSAWTSSACALAAALHLLRLRRWQGWRCWNEKLVLILHLAYAFVPAGFAAVTLSSLGWMQPVAALHVFTVGAIGVMTLAIMSRATRGHTGLPLAATGLTTTSYSALIAATLLRPMASIWPDLALELLSAAGLFWIIGFALFVAEYGPHLIARHQKKSDLG